MEGWLTSDVSEAGLKFKSVGYRSITGYRKIIVFSFLFSNAGSLIRRQHDELYVKIGNFLKISCDVCENKTLFELNGM